MFRHGEPIWRHRANKSVFRLHHHLAVAVDQTGLAVDIDLRKAEVVIINDAILRGDDFAAVFIDETVEAAKANGRAVVPEFADPIVFRMDRDRTVTPDGAAEAARKGAHR